MKLTIVSVPAPEADEDDHCSCCEHCYPDQCVGKCELRDCDLDRAAQEYAWEHEETE